MEYFSLLGLGILFTIGWMFFTWFIYLYIKNPAIVDVSWVLCVFGVSFLYYIYGFSHFYLSNIVLFSIFIWMFRLATSILFRLCKTHVDRRYRALDKKWEEHRSIKYLIFFLFQGFGAVILTIPVLFVMLGSSRSLNFFDFFGLLFVVVGFVGEMIADTQLQIFRRKKSKKNEVCEKGLWYYSRHPNYFFEWVFWMGMFLFAISFSWGFVALISPLALLYTLLYVTGIPPAEEQSLRSKGDAYKAYQKRTNAFIPWKKKQ